MISEFFQTLTANHTEKMLTRSTNSTIINGTRRILCHNYCNSLVATSRYSSTSSTTGSSNAKVKSSWALKKPQYDFKQIVSNAEKYLESAQLRKLPTESIKQISQSYKGYVEARNELNLLQAKRRTLESILTPKRKREKASNRSN